MVMSVFVESVIYIDFFPEIDWKILYDLKIKKMKTDLLHRKW